MNVYLRQLLVVFRERLQRVLVDGRTYIYIYIDIYR